MCVCVCGVCASTCASLNLSISQSLNLSVICLSAGLRSQEEQQQQRTKSSSACCKWHFSVTTDFRHVSKYVVTSSACGAEPREREGGSGCVALTIALELGVGFTAVSMASDVAPVSAS